MSSSQLSAVEAFQVTSRQEKGSAALVNRESNRTMSLAVKTTIQALFCPVENSSYEGLWDQPCTGRARQVTLVVKPVIFTWVSQPPSTFGYLLPV